MDRQLNVRRCHHFTDGLQQAIEPGILRQQRGKRRRVNAAQRRQLPENIGDQRNKASDDKYPAQLANIAAQVAHNTGYAAVKTKGSKNHRNGRQRQPLL